jgi:DNA-binding NarL/FixJ family response regulator
VIIVSSEPVIRAGLAAFFSSEPGWEVRAVDLPRRPADTWREGDAADLVVWDAAGDEASLDALRVHLPRMPAALVLVGSATEAEGAWRLGARAVLHRHAAAAALLAAARAALAGLWTSDSPFRPTPDQRMPDPDTMTEALTARELQVLRRMADGLSNKQISAALAVSESTIKFHVNAILRKLDSQSRTEAVVRAARSGLIPL